MELVVTFGDCDFFLGGACLVTLSAPTISLVLVSLVLVSLVLVLMGAHP